MTTLTDIATSGRLVHRWPPAPRSGAPAITTRSS